MYSCCALISRSSQGPTFPGLLRLVEAYLETLAIGPSERQQIDKYVDLIRRRANGARSYFILALLILTYRRLVAHDGRLDAKLCSIPSVIQI